MFVLLNFVYLQKQINNKMKTTWSIKNIKKTTKDEEYTEITFKDYRGEWTVKLDDPRHLVQDLDKFANYKEIV